MKKRLWWGMAAAVILVCVHVMQARAYTPLLLPSGGGTGTSTTPLSGQTLIGNASGTYTVANLLGAGCITVATSSGGITLSCPVAPATSTINGTQSTVFQLVGDGTTVTSTVSGATTTFSIINTGNWAGTWQGVNSSTFYLASNPNGYISSAAATSTITASGTTLTGPAFTFGSTTIIQPYTSGTSLYWLFINPGYITTSTFNASITISTAAPLGGGGTLSNNGTISLTCATCSTLATTSPFTANAFTIVSSSNALATGNVFYDPVSGQVYEGTSTQIANSTGTYMHVFNSGSLTMGSQILITDSATTTQSSSIKFQDTVNGRTLAITGPFSGAGGFIVQSSTSGAFSIGNGGTGNLNLLGSNVARFTMASSGAFAFEDLGGPSAGASTGYLIGNFTIGNVSAFARTAAPTGGQLVQGDSAFQTTSTITNGTNFGKQIQVAQTSTFQGAVSTTITNALVFAGSNGVLAGYAATSCAAGTAFTGLSATGTPTCTSYAPSSTIYGAGQYLGTSGSNLTVSSTLASSSLSFNIYDATTTAPYRYAKWQSPVAITIAQVSCDEYAAATTTIELYKQSSLATTTVGSDVVASIACGINGTTTTTFATSSLNGSDFLIANVSTTAGTPSWTSLHVLYKKN